MTTLYPTDPETLSSLSENEWQALLLKVSQATDLPSPRQVVRVRLCNKRGFDRWAILADLKEGMSGAEVARKYGVTTSYVSRVKNGHR